MKINNLFAFFLFYCLPSLVSAQSIGLSVGTTFTHISKGDFGEAKLDDFQIYSLNQKLSFAIHFEYPLSTKLRLRAEVSYFSTSYELRDYYDYDIYRLKGFGFQNLQMALLADMLILPINKVGYLAAHGGFGVSYTALNLIRTGYHIGGAARATGTPIFTDNTQLSPNPKANIALILGVSFNKESHKGKFSIGLNYNRALISSPKVEMEIMKVQNNQFTDYSQSLSPKIHFLNVYVGHAWFLKKREKKKE